MTNDLHMQGLTDNEVNALRAQYGFNVFTRRRSWRALRMLRELVLEPMFILLLVACVLYFFLGLPDEGILMLAAMMLVSSISVYQETKSNHALRALQQLTAPRVTVLRNGAETQLASAELVPGDVVFLTEGMVVPADGTMIQGNDCFVNESTLTGESIPVAKYTDDGHNELLQGTTLDSGKCTLRITQTGNRTKLGSIGKSIDTYQSSTTLLQKQVKQFVRSLAVFGFISFAIVFLVNYLHHHDAATSLLFALTLAMSVVPEEIPVAFSSFMALGAYRMSRLGIISRKPQVIENLGAVSVVCLDKTGTITENRMEVVAALDYATDKLYNGGEMSDAASGLLLQCATLASETDPFDPMEKAIWDRYTAATGKTGYAPFTISTEYPLEGRPPMMTHVHLSPEGTKTAFAKGALERILRVCGLEETARAKIEATGQSFADKGYRVIGIATAENVGDEVPATQDEFNWTFKGILALYDPPRPGMQKVIVAMQSAGIRVKMLTGDHPGTALNIAALSGFANTGRFVTGDEVMQMDENKLDQTVRDVSIFARMFPEAKHKVVETLKAQGEIVAMTGDGVNDGSALHAADIGVAMGKKGTEIARQAADMVITDDDLGRMVLAIQEGRRIFLNLVKSVRYIISIHIPIILTASIPVILNWKFPNIFTPIHVIFLELIMGPTCSIFFEREPVESRIMQQPPRARTTTLFTGKELKGGIFQGLSITACVLSLYYFSMANGATLEETRNVVFTTLLLSNVLLTFSSRSITESIFTTIRYRNPLTGWILMASAILVGLLQFVAPVNRLFQFHAIGTTQWLLCLGASFASVVLVEVYKWLQRSAQQRAS